LEIIKSLKGVFELEALQEFLDFVFSDHMLTLYTTLNINSPEVVDFHRELAKEIFEIGT
jgi:hypothetical protein